MCELRPSNLPLGPITFNDRDRSCENTWVHTLAGPDRKSSLAQSKTAKVIPATQKGRSPQAAWPSELLSPAGLRNAAAPCRALSAPLVYAQLPAKRRAQRRCLHTCHPATKWVCPVPALLAPGRARRFPRGKPRVLCITSLSCPTRLDSPEGVCVRTCACVRVQVHV